ncbi:hypothetical protein [Guggenheimella bovis]
MKRIVALFLLLLLSFETCFAEVPLQKKEIVYVKLDSLGNVENTSVMNIFDVSNDQLLKDFGSYESAVNLTSKEEMKVKEGEVLVPVKRGSFTYEGKNPKGELPWNITFSYELEGKPVDIGLLPGSKGKVVLHGSIAPSGKNNTFSDRYMLQLRLSFPTECVTVVKADGATRAMEGSNELLNYIVFPKEKFDFFVELDATSFEMAGIQISALPFKMDMNIPNLSTYTDDIKVFQDAIVKLDDSVQLLNDGTKTLSLNGDALVTSMEAISSGLLKTATGQGKLAEGLSVYRKGLGDFKTGFLKYTEGIQTLTNTLKEMSGNTKGLTDYAKGVKAFTEGILKELPQGSEMDQKGLEELKQASFKLSHASSEIRDGLALMAKETGSMNGGSITGLSEGSSQFLAGLRALKSGLNVPQVDVTGPVTTVFTEAGKLQALAQGIEDQALRAELLDSAKNLSGAGSDLQKALQSLGGIQDLSKAVDDLVTNYEKIDGGIQRLSQGLSDAGSLGSAIETLSNQYGQFDQGLKSFSSGVDELIGRLQGYKAPDLGSLKEAATKLSKASDQMISQTPSTDTRKLVELEQGTKSLKAAIEKLYLGFEPFVSGSIELKTANASISGGADEYAKGLRAYIEGVQKTSQGTSALKSGTGALRQGTTDIDQLISDKLQTLKPEDFKMVSFVDERNEVDMVQFVFLTDGFKPIKSKPIAVPEVEKTGFWDSLMNLFK